MKNIEQVKIDEGRVILVFSTEWCPDCMVLKQYIDQVVAENVNWQFVYIDSDEHPNLAEEYGILGIPSFVALIDGKQVSSFISKASKSKQEINGWIAVIEVNTKMV